MSGSEEGLWTGNSPVGRQRPRPIRQLIALIQGTTYLGVEAEPLYVGATLQVLLGTHAGDGLQRQHFLTRAWAQCNAVGAGRRLQRCHGRICIVLGHVGNALIFDKVACSGQ